MISYSSTVGRPERANGDAPVFVGATKIHIQFRADPPQSVPIRKLPAHSGAPGGRKPDAVLAGAR